MHIIVGGCGRLGAEIANRLSDEPDNDVVVVDPLNTAFDALGSTFNGETVVGDVTDRNVLERASIVKADGLLAVTPDDNANLMAVEVATHLYSVPRTVARLFNPARETSYKKLGIRYVSGTGIMAKLFLNEFRSATFQHHLHFDYGDVAVVEMRLGPNAHGMSVAEFEIEGKLRIAGIQRGARVLIPTSDDRLERGDLIVGAAKRGVYAKLINLIESESRRRLKLGQVD